MDKDEVIAILKDAGFEEVGFLLRRGETVVDVRNEMVYVLKGRVMIDVPVDEITCMQYDREFDDIRIETEDTTHVFQL